MLTRFLDTLVLLGALQGFIVSRLLITSARRHPEERTSRRLLAQLILLFSLACLDIYLEHFSFWTSTLIGGILSAIIPLIIIMPVGPLLYFYIRSCVEPDFQMSRRFRPHFYPVIIDLFQHVAALLFVICLFTGVIPRNTQHFGVFLDDYDQYSDIPRWISLTIYLYMSTRYLRRAPAKGIHFVWLRSILRVFWAFDVLWLVFLIPYELPKIGDALIDHVDWYPLYLPLVAIIYFLGIKGYFIYRPMPMPVAGKRTALPEERVDRLILALKRSMEVEQLWLNADLNLGRLAQSCGAAPKLLSTVLNQHMDTTFNEFVNRYRIGAVQKRLLLPESRELTIAGLAYECGFNSLPTFQRAFKSITGMSPKEFLSEQAQL